MSPGEALIPRLDPVTKICFGETLSDSTEVTFRFSTSQILNKSRRMHYDKYKVLNPKRVFPLGINMRGLSLNPPSYVHAGVKRDYPWD